MSDEDQKSSEDQSPRDHISRLIGQIYQRNIMEQEQGRDSELHSNAETDRGSPTNQDDSKTSPTPTDRRSLSSSNLQENREFLRSWNVDYTSWTKVPTSQENVQPPVYETRPHRRLENAAVRPTIERVSPWNTINIAQEDFSLSYPTRSRRRLTVEAVPHWSAGSVSDWDDVATSSVNVGSSNLAETGSVNIEIESSQLQGEDTTTDDAFILPKEFIAKYLVQRRRSTSEEETNFGILPSWTRDVATPLKNVEPSYLTAARVFAGRDLNLAGRTSLEIIASSGVDNTRENIAAQLLVTYGPSYFTRTRGTGNRRSTNKGRMNSKPLVQAGNTSRSKVATSHLFYRRGTTSERSVNEGRPKTVTSWDFRTELSWNDETLTQEFYKTYYYNHVQGAKHFWDEEITKREDHSEDSISARDAASQRVDEQLNVVEIKTVTDEQEVPSKGNATTTSQEGSKLIQSSEVSGFGGQRSSNVSSHLVKDSASDDLTRKVPKETFNTRPGPNEPYTTMNVPTNMVGRIIGRGGSRINELQNVSGTQIFVPGDRTVYKETMIKIYGDKESIAKAQELIDEIITQASGSRHSRSRLSDPPQLDAVSPKINLDPDESFDWAALNEQCEQAQKEHWAKLPKFIKNFYKEDPVVANFTAAQVIEIRYKNNKIVVSRVFEEKSGNTTIKNPIVTFDQAFRHYPGILAEIKKAGFSTPSPIQCQAWPLLLSGEDIIGIAQTGTGKTLAFLLPALIHIDGQELPRSKRGGPNVLILAPTRELALQIKREVDKYQYRGIRAVCLYGGGDRREQVQAVTKGVEIIIATPGRLNDLVMGDYIDLSSITYLVLDEADRMLDMGFEPQIRKTLLDIRPDRQTVMTSATWPSGVRRLAQSYMDNPVQIYVGSLDLAAVHTVTQTIIIMEDSENEKFETLLDWVHNMSENFKAIIFCGKKIRADYISSELVGIGVNCQSIHGDRDQSDREQALIDIADGSVKILVATDVASRGLDIQDITHVINYDFPRNIEEYVHRVGRTGRAGRTGESITYLTKQDWSHARELINILQEADQFIPDELEEMALSYEAMKERRTQERAPRDGGGRGGGNRHGGGSYKDKTNVFYEEFDGFSYG